MARSGNQHKLNTRKIKLYFLQNKLSVRTNDAKGFTAFEIHGMIAVGDGDVFNTAFGGNQGKTKVFVQWINPQAMIKMFV